MCENTSRMLHMEREVNGSNERNIGMPRFVLQIGSVTNQILLLKLYLIWILYTLWLCYLCSKSKDTPSFRHMFFFSTVYIYWKNSKIVINALHADIMLPHPKRYLGKTPLINMLLNQAIYKMPLLVSYLLGIFLYLSYTLPIMEAVVTNQDTAMIR